MPPMQMNWAEETEKQLDGEVPSTPVKAKPVDWTVATEEQKSLLPEIPEIIEDVENFQIPDVVIIEGQNDSFVRYSWALEMDPKASPDDENPDEVLIQTIEHMKRTFHKVNKNEAARRKWHKYGMSENDSAGPNNTTTTLSADDVPIIFSNRRHIVHNQAVTLNETEEQELMDQRRTIISQLKANKMTKDKAPSQWASGDPVSAASGGKVSFIDRVKDRVGTSGPSDSIAQGASGLRRSGEELASRPGRPQSSYAQEEGCTCRVTNFTENMVEGDFHDLFGTAGKIKRIYLAKDKKTQRSRGFAYVTYDRPTEAQKAISTLNRFPLDHLILNVELSKKEKTN